MANQPSTDKTQWNCRVPKDVLADAKTRASGDGTDVTAVVVWALREYGAGRITPPPPTVP